MRRRIGGGSIHNEDARVQTRMGLETAGLRKR